MESVVLPFFSFQWQRKVVAIITAIIIWFFVNHTITATKVIPGVPIRVINLPANKTISGLLPSGFLVKRTTLTLSGAKEAIDQLEHGDIEVLLDASNFGNESIIQINKKNLISLDPSLDLSKQVTSVSNPEFIIKMSDLVTESIPIIVHPPSGSAPNGYRFLDLWPTQFMQTVSGPQDQILQLKNEGLELSINLDMITQSELDAIFDKNPNEDEISYPVPEKWKKIVIPTFAKNGIQINDPSSAFFTLNFLHTELVPLQQSLPIHIFYPLKDSAVINPTTFPLEETAYIKFKNSIPLLTLPLYAKNVSKLFLNIVKDNLELEVVTAPTTERERLEWDVGFIDKDHLEDMYVAFLLANSKSTFQASIANKNKERENLFRKRFQLYLQQFTLYLSPEHKLELDSRLKDHLIRIKVPNATLLSQPK